MFLMFPQSRAESSSSIYPILSRLQILSEVEAASECLNDISCPTKVWNNMYYFMQFEFLFLMYIFDIIVVFR